MDEAIKFRLRVFIYYIFVEPWTSKFTLPNWRSLAWIFIIIAAFVRNQILIFTSIGLGIILYGYYEYKSGKYIYWYRNRKYPGMKKALNQIRKNKNGSEVPDMQERESIDE